MHPPQLSQRSLTLPVTARPVPFTRVSSCRFQQRPTATRRTLQLQHKVTTRRGSGDAWVALRQQGEDYQTDPRQIT